MIVWAGNNYDVCLNTGGRYLHSTDTWITTSTGTNCPAGRQGHVAVWTGTEMIIWGGGLSGGGIYSPPPAITGTAAGCYGASAVTLSTGSNPGYQWLKDGSPIDGATGQNCIVTEDGDYSVRITRRDGCTVDSSPYTVSFLSAPMPTVTGNFTGCVGVGAALSTQLYSSYQWIKDGLDISGATNQDYTATEAGSYSVRVAGSNGCSRTSPAQIVTILPGPTPVITGPDSGCGSVNLSTDPYSTYQWKLNGIDISNATSQSYDANVSGDYSVEVITSEGCQGTSSEKTVSITFCSTSEVSPKAAVYPSRFSKDSGSSTGYYLYFQKIDGVTGYNIYEGTMGSWYSHSGQPGNVCAATVTDLGTGEMRAEIAPSAGDHYYLVTAYAGSYEGPSGYNSGNVEIDPLLSSCSP
ncbi:MAG TPA: hypothetical protein PK747_01050 [Acidobacteriota bacterium]|nr:hypothetical protein [Acidobacteriota bacterium]HNT18017.1 hypothetical protein [Acidobacteriota bacterium]HQO19490.1 hypothetical protein [Acidobacteriota bacterium]HQQ45980.1 hypothetical protein [Acidobacteriota bacterium]